MELGNTEKIESLMLGDYKIIQSENLYRFTSDAIYLSRFAGGKKGDVVCDICAGSGIVGLHFYALNERMVKSLDFVELQKPLADMCRKSVALNGLQDKLSVYNMRIQDLTCEHFDKYSLVLCNPPYKKYSSGIVSEREDIAICKHEITVSIDDISSCAQKILKDGGRICLCNKCERLEDVMLSFNKFNLSPSRLSFICGSENSKPYLFFIEAYKGVKKQLCVEKFVVNSAKDFSGN